MIADGCHGQRAGEAADARGGAERAEPHGADLEHALGEQRQKREITPAIRASLVKWYGDQRGQQVKHAEAFEICEYGRQPNEAQVRELFPMLK